MEEDTQALVTEAGPRSDSTAEELVQLHEANQQLEELEFPNDVCRPRPSKK